MTCAAAYRSADGGPSSPPDTPVRIGEFDIVVFDLENTAMTSARLTVRYNSPTVFRNLTPAMVLVGTFVDVKGDLNSGVIAALKVELH